MYAERVREVVDVNRAIATTVKSGKVLFGANNAVKTAKAGKAKLIVVAANCPRNIQKDIERYCGLSNLPILYYRGTSMDLGAACGKPFTVSALTVRDPGDSEILKLVEAGNV